MFSYNINLVWNKMVRSLAFRSLLTCKNHHLGCNHIISSLFQLFDPKLFLKADLRTKEDLRRDQVLGQSNC